MRAACERCHQDAVQTSTVGVHADSIACSSCHGVHDMRPVPDPATHGIDVAMARACSGCHTEVGATWWSDIHGTIAARQASSGIALGSDTAPTCISCHGEHGIRRHTDPVWRHAVADACSNCHAAYGTTYRDSYHGQATRVGSESAAQCHDCHTPHHVLPASDSASSVSTANTMATCQGCHQEAGANFISYQPHANPRDRAQHPLLFVVWASMNTILFGTMVVWGAHAAVWFWRNWRERRKRMEEFLHVHGHRAPMDSALRGGPPYVWRFNVIFRVIHGLIILTFFLLVLTGLPLRFSCAVWAPGLASLLGGPETAGAIHRGAGLVMFGYFFLYLGYIAVRFVGSREKLGLFSGANTILFRLQDLRDVVAMMKYFFGRGPHPRFGRYSYMEKFDYFAELWGVFVIGFTGLMLWFPEAFSTVFPGIAFNIAIIVHSYEAMIATAFIFTIHFFNVHLRPEKWPLDAVMFTGRASLAYLEEEHPLMAEQIAEHVRTAPVSHRAVHDEPAPPPSQWMNIFGAIAGLLLLSLGLVLIGLILWGSLC
jgi:cytochrome b subunit of formate dehydrogenase